MKVTSLVCVTASARTARNTYENRENRVDTSFFRRVLPKKAVLDHSNYIHSSCKFF